MLESFYNWRRAVPFVSLALAAAFAPDSIFAAPQKVTELKPAAATQSPAKPPVKSWSVRMSKSAPYTFTVKAKESPLPEIADELAKLTKVPVTLSPVMAKQKVTITLDRSKADRARSLLGVSSTSEVIDLALDRVINAERLRRDIDAYRRVPATAAADTSG